MRESMQIEFIWAGVICVFLLIYLTYTILYPEKF
jgi:K+-transporting ATPase KdpF subunit